jgi:hypothetical protein
MKRYLLFAGDCYYPCGGFCDFVTDFDTIEEATESALANEKDNDWAQVVDGEQGQIVRDFNRDTRADGMKQT